jgi:Domain of unknown function (DUF4388)
MEGDLSLLSIPDLLQMICLGGYSRDVHLFDGPTQLGVIAIRNGRVDRCFGYGAWGEAAFFKLVNLRRGRYKVNDAQDMSASDATLTAYSWQELLMEAARQQDEAARVVHTAAASAGRVIQFPTLSTHPANVTGPDQTRVESREAGPMMLRDSSPQGSAETQFDFPSIFDTPTTVSSVPVAGPRFDLPRPLSDTGKHAPIISSVPAVTEAKTEAMTLDKIKIAQPPAVVPTASVEPAPAAPSDDVTNLLQEATACYLRRDLVRAEALLQKCLELRPGDKRALQNLERIRRKKSP